MIDWVEITVKAGDGGDGRVSFLRQKYRPKGGPDGGDGGDGGSVWAVVEAGMNTLAGFRHRRVYEADRGEMGSKNKRHGKAGEDVVLKLPVGCEVRLKRGRQVKGLATITQDNADKTELPLWYDLRRPGEKVLLAQGGKGGRGNWRFRSSTNQTPQEFEAGTKGEDKELVLELKLLANVGLVGLPNAGKSTLLSVLTKAEPRVAAYPFTTLEPNLGVMVSREKKEVKSLVLADIPGLIEGAAEGKGLGHQFLRHVERTKVLVHLVAPKLPATELVKQLVSDYQTIRKELVEHGKKLVKKKEIVVVSQADLLTPAQKREAIRGLKRQLGLEPLVISAVSHEGLAELRRVIWREFGEVG